MATKWTKGLRNFINNFGGFKQAMSNGEMCIYQGTPPTGPNDAIVGTLLAMCTNNGGAITPEIQARGTVTITGIAENDTMTGITVNSIEILGSTITAIAGETVATFAAKLATAINAYHAKIRYRAWSDGAVLYIEAMPGTGTSANAYAVAATAGTGATHTEANIGAGGVARAGVAGVNGIQIGASVDGVMQTSGVWRTPDTGAVGTGTANFFVIYGNVTDDSLAADASPYHCRRIVGTCGTVGADYNMQSTAITAGKTHSVDSSAITLGESN